MNTSVRVRHDERGFSFVELLVTIIIAGIAFAAIVPLFAGAQQKNAADLFRQAALNAAQGRIEQIRSLDFASIETTTLASTLETTAPVTNGRTRQLTVGYEVTNKPSDINTKYKVVTVTVSWTAPPNPVKPVVLQTIVYRQYAGPTLSTFWTIPAISQNGQLGDNNGIVKFSAIPTTPWTGQRTKSVLFQVWDTGGRLVTAQLVYNTSIPDPSNANGSAPCGFDLSTNTFWWNWDSTGARDGAYSASATAAAASTGSYLGPTTSFFFNLSRGITMDPPTGLVITPGATQASLTWIANGATGYKVYRGTSAGGPFSLIPSTTLVAMYNDTGLPSSTNYWYEVSSVDSSGAESARCAPVGTKTLGASTDTTAPSVPTWGSPAITHDVAGTGVIELKWNASTDTGSGLGDYRIWRSDSASGLFTVIATWTNLNNLVYDDTVGSGVTRYYYITARDVVLNESAANTTQSATTATTTTAYMLTITNSNNGNNAGSDRWVWVQMITPSTAYYSQSGGLTYTTIPTIGVLVPRQNGTAVFSGLPPGRYNIWVNTSNSSSGAAVQTSATTTISNANASASIN